MVNDGRGKIVDTFYNLITYIQESCGLRVEFSVDELSDTEIPLIVLTVSDISYETNNQRLFALTGTEIRLDIVVQKNNILTGLDYLETLLKDLPQFEPHLGHIILGTESIQYTSTIARIGVRMVLKHQITYSG